MPKKEIDYGKTVIYRIVCNDPTVTDCYVGYTTNLSKRRYQNKTESERNSNSVLYEFIKSHGGMSNWSIIEIEKYKDCKTYEEALSRQRHWMEHYKASLNRS